jgi:hypothetical protein
MPDASEEQNLLLATKLKALVPKGKRWRAAMKFGDGILIQMSVDVSADRYVNIRLTCSFSDSTSVEKRLRVSDEADLKADFDRCAGADIAAKAKQNGTDKVERAIWDASMDILLQRWSLSVCSGQPAVTEEARQLLNAEDPVNKGPILTPKKKGKRARKATKGAQPKSKRPRTQANNAICDHSTTSTLISTGTPLGAWEQGPPPARHAAVASPPDGFPPSMVQLTRAAGGTSVLPRRPEGTTESFVNHPLITGERSPRDCWGASLSRTELGEGPMQGDLRVEPFTGRQPQHDPWGASLSRAELGEGPMQGDSRIQPFIVGQPQQDPWGASLSRTELGEGSMQGDLRVEPFTGGQQYNWGASYEFFSADSAPSNNSLQSLASTAQASSSHWTTSGSTAINAFGDDPALCRTGRQSFSTVELAPQMDWGASLGAGELAGAWGMNEAFGRAEGHALANTGLMQSESELPRDSNQPRPILCTGR